LYGTTFTGDEEMRRQVSVVPEFHIREFHPESQPPANNCGEDALFQLVLNLVNLERNKKAKYAILTLSFLIIGEAMEDPQATVMVNPTHIVTLDTCLNCVGKYRILRDNDLGLLFWDVARMLLATSGNLDYGTSKL